MATVTVWTKQHEGVLKTLEETGRYIVKREYIVQKLEDISSFYLDVYHWYTTKAAAFAPKPPDVRYPIWVSLAPASVLQNDEGTVVLEVEVDDAQLVRVDYDGWDHVVNYLYLPKDAADAERHGQLLTRYGIDDPEAYLSSFYPMIKKDIIKSWDRLFETNNATHSPVQMGTIWEIQAPWVKKIIR